MYEPSDKLRGLQAAAREGRFLCDSAAGELTLYEQMLVATVSSGQDIAFAARYAEDAVRYSRQRRELVVRTRRNSEIAYDAMWEQQRLEEPLSGPCVGSSVGAPTVVVNNILEGAG